MLVVVQKGNAKHIDCLGSSRFRCGCALSHYYKHIGKNNLVMAKSTAMAIGGV